MKVFSLFSGIGGFDLACQRHGHRIIGACEIDRYAKAVYAGHFTGVPIHKDVTKIRPEELPDFDILCAGFPCQAFSIAGKRLGFEESRGTLFFEIVRIAKEKRPRFLLLENVGGLLSHDRGKTFAVILAALDEIGYDAQWQVLNSKYFVPQNRERVFIIANLREEPRPEVFPLGGSVERNSKSGITYMRKSNQTNGRIYSVRGIARTITSTESNKTGFYAVDGKITQKEITNCADANYHKGLDNHGQRTMIAEPKIKSLGSFPFPFMRRKNEPEQKKIAEYLRSYKKISITELSENTGIIKTKLEHFVRTDKSGALPDKEDWLSLKKELQFDDTHDKIMTEYVEDYKTHEMQTRVHDSSGISPTLTSGEKHIAIPVLTPDRINKRQNGRRFKEDGDPSFTLTTQDKHGVFDGYRIRILTPLECEKLQGFPDRWTESGIEAENTVTISDTQRYRCLGNAVTVPVVEHIMKKLTEFEK